MEIPVQVGQTEHLSPSSPRDHGDIEAHPEGAIVMYVRFAHISIRGPLMAGRPVTRLPPESHRSPPALGQALGLPVDAMTGRAERPDLGGIADQQQGAATARQ